MPQVQRAFYVMLLLALLPALGAAKPTPQDLSRDPRAAAYLGRAPPCCTDAVACAQLPH